MAKNIEVEERKQAGYRKTDVETIIRRMKKVYQERGYSEEEAKALVLKRAVTGTRAIDIETMAPKDLVKSNNALLRIVGIVFSRFSFLSSLAEKIADSDIGSRLMRALDSVNSRYSTSQYIAIAMFVSLFSAFILSLLFTFALMDIADPVVMFPIVFITSYLFSFFIALKLPESNAKRRGKNIDKVLPFALRHFATEIKAGVGIHKAMRAIANSGYGALSEEFQRVIDEIEKGVTTEDALEALANRTESDDLARSILHIIRALRTGGNLSEILTKIADDVSFNLAVRMRDFSERLTLISLFYMMAGVVFPVFISVLFAIFSSAPSLGLAGVVGPDILMMIYLIIIPMSLGVILYIINVTQPM